MQPESLKFLYDISNASELLMRFADGKSFAEYSEDDMLRSAVERQFEIIGEAINQLSRTNPDTASRISDYKQIIAFRNILIHGYAQVDDRIVWDLLSQKLPILQQEANALLEEGTN